MNDWNVLATSVEGARPLLMMGLRRLGVFRGAGYRNVAIGRVDDVAAFLEGWRDAMASDTVLAASVGRVLPIARTFGIDEASSSQRGATATFVVRYGGRVVCRLTVSWGAPRSCPGLTDRVVADGGILTVEQSVNPARGDRGLWAGVLDPTLIVG